MGCLPEFLDGRESGHRSRRISLEPKNAKPRKNIYITCKSIHAAREDAVKRRMLSKANKYRLGALPRVSFRCSSGGLEALLTFGLPPIDAFQQGLAVPGGNLLAAVEAKDV